MKMLELAVPYDGRELYRQIAKKAIEGNEMEPKKSVPVQLYEVPEVDGKPDPAFVPPVKDDLAKLVNAVRSGLSGVKEGVRFSVEHKGQLAWVSVNEAPAKARKPKVAKPAAVTKIPKPGGK